MGSRTNAHFCQARVLVIYKRQERWREVFCNADFIGKCLVTFGSVLIKAEKKTNFV